MLFTLFFDALFGGCAFGGRGGNGAASSVAAQEAEPQSSSQEPGGDLNDAANGHAAAPAPAAAASDDAPAAAAAGDAAAQPLPLKQLPVVLRVEVASKFSAQFITWSIMLVSPACSRPAPVVPPAAVGRQGGAAA